MKVSPCAFLLYQVTNLGKSDHPGVIQPFAKNNWKTSINKVEERQKLTLPKRKSSVFNFYFCVYVRAWGKYSIVNLIIKYQ